jgi:hypothetical protein
MHRVLISKNASMESGPPAQPGRSQRATVSHWRERRAPESNHGQTSWQTTEKNGFVEVRHGRGSRVDRCRSGPIKSKSQGMVEIGTSEHYTAVARIPKACSECGCSFGLRSSWSRRPGEAFTRYQEQPSPETASCDCDRGVTRGEQERAATQLVQAQFHCGRPPPAAAPAHVTTLTVRFPRERRS